MHLERRLHDGLSARLGRLDVCAALALSPRVGAGACMGIAWGAVHTQGVGYPSSRGTFEDWLAVVNEAHVSWDVGAGWAIDLSGALLLPTGRNSIVLRSDDGHVRASRDLPPVGWSLGLGPVRRF